MTPRVDPMAGARTVARLLDSAGRVPGTSIRFGLDPLLGLVPGVGDLTGALLSGYIVLTGARLGAPASIIWRMLLNIAIDTVVGMVPILGDLFDVGWKSNMRNLELLERYRAEPATTTSGSRLVVVGTLFVLGLLAGAGAVGTFLLLRTIVAWIR